MARDLLSRRALMGRTAAALACSAVATRRSYAWPSFKSNAGKPSSVINGVQIGVISYSFRSMADQTAAAVLQYCLDCGINGLELMGDPAEAYAGIPSDPNAVKSWRASVPMVKFAELRSTYNRAGVHIYAFKPSTFESTNTDDEVDYGFRAAKTLGASHVTVEMPTDPAQTQRLGDAALRHGMRIGYHAHTQATPTLWDQALAQSRGNGINLDLGHFVAADDFDAVGFVRAHHAQMLSMHLKDRKSKAHGQADLPWGQGDTPIRSVLQLMRNHRYRFPASIEMEYDIPAGSDAVREVRNCLEYCRQGLIDE